MAAQLCLNLPDPRSQPRRVWFLSVRDEDQGALRRILAQDSRDLVDALDGRCAVSASDFILARLGDDDYEAWGCPPDGIEVERALDLTAALADSLEDTDQRGRDLIGFCRGRRAPDPSESRPGTPIEDLFRLLRQDQGQLGAAARLRLCRRALTNLGDDQPRVRARLQDQSHRLARLLALRPAELPLRGRLEAAAERIGWCQGDLFAAPRPWPAPRDLSLQSVRVRAVCVASRPTANPRPFAQLIPGGERVRIEEVALSARLEPLSSHRLVAAAAWSQGSEIEARIDWEVTLSFARLLPRSLQTAPLRMWLETLDGEQASLATLARVGENIRFGPTPRLVAEGVAAGVVAFEDDAGRRARSAFRLSRAA